MKATFNYTGRKRIPRSKVAVKVEQAKDGVRIFDAQFHLDSLGLPADAEVSVEAYYKRSFMRFPFGTVGLLVPCEDRRLVEIEHGDQVFFRVKVSQRDPAGVSRILAMADGLTPGANTDISHRDPLLPVNHHPDMGQVVWRVVIDENRGPVLEVNSRVEGIRETVKSDPVFFALVYPAVIKQVLLYILCVRNETDDVDETGSWEGDWLMWVKRFYSTSPPDPNAEEGEKEAWIDAAVAGFCAHQRTRDRYSEAIQERRS